MDPFEIDRELDEVFDACLDRMANGQSIEECLRDYDGHRERLQPLLEAAQATLSAASAVEPSRAARIRGRARLRERLDAELPVRSGSRWWRLRVPRPLAVPMTAALAIALIVLGGGSIAAVVADDSVPGDNLYWVKRTKENVVLTLSRSDTGKAQTHAELAGVRGEELRKLIEQGRIAAAERHLASVHQHLRASAEHVGVVVTLNRIEMPSAPIAIEGTAELVALVVTLERDGDLLRIDPLYVHDASLQEQRQRIERIKREFELSYRALVSALYPDVLSGPFWRVETIGIQSSIR